LVILKQLNEPNVLWICTDQQRFDSLGCYGNEYVHTPNLDRLAENGVLFERCYAQNPVCTPSRSSFLTGRYPRTTRCRQNGQSIPESETLISKVFADAGYICGLSGKFHLSACHPSVCKINERRVDDGYSQFNWSHSDKALWPGNEYRNWLNEMGVEYQTKRLDESEYVEVGMPEEYHQTTWIVNKAINFIESSRSFDMPWFFSLNIFDPHAPFNPPLKYLERYLCQIDDIPEPNYVEGELENKPVFQKLEYHEGYNSRKKYKAVAMSAVDHKYTRAAYWAMIDLIDKQVGRLMELLEKRGLLDNTIVIFMSDHGELLGDHGMYYKGPFFYEPSISVPLIIAAPGVLKNRRQKALVELVDLAPTLLDAAGLEHPDGMQGRSFWDMLTGEKRQDFHRENVYCEFYNSLPWNNPHAYGTMVLTERYKFVAYHGIDAGELYDFKNDPAETRNLWDQEECKDLKLEMYRILCDRMAETVDPLPLRQSPW
jgi:arylsulfatase